MSKDEFHRRYQTALRALAKRLGLQRGQYRLKSNRGGDGIIGEVVLHTDKLYVCVSGHDLEGDRQFMYRSCNGMKDYSGGANNWAPMAWLTDDPDRAIGAFEQVMK